LWGKKEGAILDAGETHGEDRKLPGEYRTAGDFARGEILDEVGPEGFVLAMIEFAGWRKKRAIFVSLFDLLLTYCHYIR